MIRALILDDEPFSAKYLERLLLDNCPEISQLAVKNSISDARQYLKKHRIDLLFLDIEMPEMNGIEFLKSQQLGDETAVVVVTAYDDFALASFQNNAIDYLVKPVELPALLKSIKKSIKFLGISVQSRVEKPVRRMSVYANNEYHIVDLEELQYLKAEGNYTQLILKDKKFLLSKKIGELEQELPAEQFFRVHRSFIVNLNFVKQIGKKNEHYVQLASEEIIPLTEKKHAELLMALTK